MDNILSNKYRHKKEKMFEHDPHCRRCGILMWLPLSGNERVTKKLSEEQLNTMATIGHKYSRFDERRWTEHAHNKCYQLICYKCNFDEYRKEDSSLPIERKWEISKAYPKDHPMAVFNELNKYKK